MSALVLELGEQLALMGVTSDRDLAAIEELEGVLLGLPQKELICRHSFAPGVYTREMFAEADTFVIGAEHKTEHLNILLSGSAQVLVNGRIQTIKAPCVLKSMPGTRKIAVVLEDMRWLNIHPNPTNETDPEKLEELLTKKSPTYLRHMKSIKEAAVKTINEGVV